MGSEFKIIFNPETGVKAYLDLKKGDDDMNNVPLNKKVLIFLRERG